MEASYFKYQLKFNNTSGTSRGLMTTKDTWFVQICDRGQTGIGECGMFYGLSFDDRPDFEDKLQWACSNIHLGLELLLDQLSDFPAIQFGLEIAFLDLNSEVPHILFPSKFTKGQDKISINGLVWMGDIDFMKTQIKANLSAGFHCIKIKIGSLDFETEIDLIHSIRKQFDADTVEIRVDANGAFSSAEVLEKLKRLSDFQLHSIEQPIATGQTDTMAELCLKTPLPIALDEELIGVRTVTKKVELLQTIKPQYIILKPTLVGGFSGSQSWIDIANSQSVGWWVTSALESNIGLNAIAQWTYNLKVNCSQGLGTGTLFANNIQAPLEITQGCLVYNTSKKWKLNFDQCI